MQKNAAAVPRTPFEGIPELKQNTFVYSIVILCSAQNILMTFPAR